MTLIDIFKNNYQQTFMQLKNLTLHDAINEFQTINEEFTLENTEIDRKQPVNCNFPGTLTSIFPFFESATPLPQIT